MFSRFRGVTVLEDSHFSVVEFAAAAADWLRQAPTDIVFFRPANPHWRAGSAWGVVDGVPVALEELVHALEVFIGELEDACRRYLGVDIGPALEPGR